MVKKDKINNILDFVPLLILTVSAIILIWKVSIGDTGLFWKHITGLILLPVSYLLFFWRHKVGVLSVGFILLLGLLGILSYSPTVVTTTIYKEIGEAKVPLFYGQLIFVLWLLIHFIVSGRHYIGIATKRYWEGLKNNSAVFFD